MAKGKRIRDLNRLIERYGGTPRHWLKKSSPVITIGNRLAEVHWYEHPDVGRVEEKLKWIES
jgi:hypothetical protein